MKVTTPVVALTLYVPSPDTVSEVLEHESALSPVSQSLTVVLLIVVPDVAVSFVVGSSTIAVATPPDLLSARAVGGSAHCKTTIPCPPVAPAVVAT